MANAHKRFLGMEKTECNIPLIGLLLIAMVMAVVYLTGDIRHIQMPEVVDEKMLQVEDENLTKFEDEKMSEIEDVKELENSSQRCDLFSGKWVYDSKSYPLYKEKQCPFLAKDFACEEFGRKETKYQHWRWQPHDCDLPRFKATALLEKLRDKRLIFVGDSLNKNQYISLVCLVQSAIPPSLKFFEWQGTLITFKAFEYNATIDFYWSPLLLESNCDDPVHHSGIKNRIVRYHGIEKHARSWTDADILIFDAFTWWLDPKMTYLWGSFGSPDAIYKEVERPRPYEMALKTWSDWVDFQVNRNKTRLFFMSIAPFHRMGEEWGLSEGQNCYDETEPISTEGYWGRCTDQTMMQIAEATIQELQTKGLKVQYLNITQLSEYRKDAHPSIYRKYWAPVTKEQLSDPKSYADCVHWCLPGVPDVWNEILFAYILDHHY